MKNIVVEYLDILGKTIVERRKQDSAVPLKNQQAENYESDLTASIQLLEKGYDVKSVISVIRDKSPMKKLLPDAHAMVLYVDKVMENVNDEWAMRAKRSLLEAEESYQHRAAAQRSNISAIHGDYQIGMAMILKDGFPLSLVEQVIRRSPINQDADESYFKTLFSALSDGQSRYADILTYDADTMNSEADVYRKFAREYMEKTHTIILSSDDEQNIIERIYRDYMQRLQEEQPIYREDTPRMMVLLKEQVQPILRKAIILASPIYVEAGRNKKEYLAGTFSEIRESLGFNRQNESVHANLTKGIVENADHQYGRAAIRLLRRHIHAEAVKKHLITLAIAAALTDPSGYANLILARAQAFLAREDAIKAFDGQNTNLCINDYMKNMHCQYTEKGFVNPDMDIVAMKEMLLSGQYTLDQIKDVMMHYSPNAVFDGLDYPSYVQKLADQEIVRENEKLSNYVVIPRSDMQENYEEEYLYQRRKMEGRIRLPYNITMDTKIVKALLNAGVESRNLSPMLSRYKPKNWDKDYPDISYGSYVMKQAEKNNRERQQIQEQVIVRTRTITNNTDNTSA